MVLTELMGFGVSVVKIHLQNVRGTQHKYQTTHQWQTQSGLGSIHGRKEPMVLIQIRMYVIKTRLEVASTLLLELAQILLMDLEQAQDGTQSPSK